MEGKAYCIDLIAKLDLPTPPESIMRYKIQIEPNIQKKWDEQVQSERKHIASIFTY